jgi:hypothetical protein
MRQVIRINWFAASDRGPGRALNSSYYHPECVASRYPNAVVRALMGELVDMRHGDSEIQNVEALPVDPIPAGIDCDQCREPARQTPSYNARPDAGWRPR